MELGKMREEPLVGYINLFYLVPTKRKNGLSLYLDLTVIRSLKMRIRRWCFFILFFLMGACTHQPIRRDRTPSTAVDTPKLKWGSLFLPEHNAPEPIRSQLARVLQFAVLSLQTEFPVVRSLHLEGTLNSKPGHIQSEQAKADFPKLFDLAICAQLAPVPLRDQCLSKVRTVISRWVATYQISGNPIDEGYFAPVFLAIDLALPLLPTAEQKALLNWLKQFASRGDTFFAAMNSTTDTRLKNNWMAWRLFIRGTVAAITNDAELKASTQSMIHDFVHDNILRAPNGNIIDGRSYDFIQRDALHYHVYDLEPLVRIELTVPGAIDEGSHEAIERGLVFIKPFYTGAEQHVEFLRTTVQFDITRCKAGQTDYCNLPWKTTSARLLFRLARPTFPAIQSWTVDVVDVNYDPMIKLLAAAFGEVAPMGKNPRAH